jgi:hypothetical protein
MGFNLVTGRGLGLHMGWVRACAPERYSAQARVPVVRTMLPLVERKRVYPN